MPRKPKRVTLPRPKAVGEILNRSFGKFRGDLLVELFKVQKNWPKIVGEELAHRTYPKEIRGSTLIVSVESPVWSHHLSMMRDQLLPVILDRAGRQFARLRFVTESIRRRTLPATAPKEMNPPIVHVARDDEDLATLLERMKKRAYALRVELQNKRR